MIQISKKLCAILNFVRMDLWKQSIVALVAVLSVAFVIDAMKIKAPQMRKWN